MEAERWQRLEEIYRETAQMSPAQRVGFLTAACDGDEELLRELHSLLIYEDKAAEFLEQPAIDVAARLVDDFSTPDSTNPPAEISGTTDLHGKQFGNFVIRECLGEGGMGEVYLADHVLLKEHSVALKRLAPKYQVDQRFHRHLLQEAERAVTLKHENIARIYDVIQEKDETFLVMEYVEGETLRKRLRTPLDIPQFLSIARQCAEGLCAAHLKRIVHLDIKPENIMITPDAKVKICDFGVARRLVSLDEDKRGESNSSRPVGGTAGYMAPELLLGRPWDHRADIFSLGVVFYEALSGQHPFQVVEDRAATTDRVLHVEPIPLRQINAAVPAMLERIVTRMLCKSPAERHGSANDVLRDLSVVQEMLTSGGFTPWRVLRRIQSHKPALTAVAVVLALFLVGAVSIADHPVRAWTGKSGLPTQRNLIILPFHTIGGGAENQEFSQGLTEAVTVKLAEFSRGRQVEIAPQSLIREHDIKTIDDARRVLDATLVLDGSLYRTAESIQITYALFDAATHLQLRGGSENVSSVEPFAVQERLVTAVAQMLELALTASEAKSVVRRGTHVPQAYDYYLVGIGYLHENESPERMDMAIQVLNRAVEQDANYALAHAGLGEAYRIKFTRFDPQNPTWLQLAQNECERSVQLDPQTAEGHSCLGDLLNTRGQYEKAQAEFNYVLRIDPTSDQGYRGLALAQDRLGDVDGAERTFQRAIDLSSHYWVGYSALARFYFDHARWADAARVFENVLSLQPGNSYAYEALGGVYVHLGNYQQGMEMLKKAMDIRPTYIGYSNLGMYYWRVRQFDEAIPMFEEAYKILPDYRVAGNLARAYYWARGRRNEGLELYQHAIELGQEQLKVNPNDADVHILLARYCAVLGRRGEAIDHVKIALKQRNPSAHFLEIAAVVYNFLGDQANAIAFLQKAVADHLPLSELLNEMELDNLHDLPQFQQLIKTAQEQQKE
jgi:serine/threonine-protein kinase